MIDLQYAISRAQAIEAKNIALNNFKIDLHKKLSAIAEEIIDSVVEDVSKRIKTAWVEHNKIDCGRMANLEWIIKRENNNEI